MPAQLSRLVTSILRARRPVLGLVVALIVAMLAGCPGRTDGGPKKPDPTGGGATGRDGGVAVGKAPGGGAAGPGALLPVEGSDCAALGCVYHAGADGYFACTSAGAGTCFHFGAVCAPTDACMFDVAGARYRHCDEVVEGRCARFGAACAPASRCMFDPGDGLHHKCEAPGDGTCKQRGPLCTP